MTAYACLLQAPCTGVAQPSKRIHNHALDLPRRGAYFSTMNGQNLFLFLCVIAVRCALAGEDVRHELEYAPAPVDNPLKGLVPYAWAADEHGDLFPHSMEFTYLPLSDLMTGEEQYNWKPLDDFLNAASKRGDQAVFRVFLEYPGKTGCCPSYLLDQGLPVHRYRCTNTPPLPPAMIETPDYTNLNLRRCLQKFIASLGKRYDGDPRIGFITAGLLGTWGEWHDYPHDEYWAPKTVQNEVLDAYAAAFHITPVLTRYPANENHKLQTSNAARPVGYHDDSFAWATLDTGKPSESWFFLAAMKAAGVDAQNKWKLFPIGGEVRPEAWGKVFDEKPDDPQIQDFQACVEQTHATWLMDSGMFNKQTWTQKRKQRAEELARRMGYAFDVRSVVLNRDKDQLAIRVEVENRGVAPFYYDWPIEYALLSDSGEVFRRFVGVGKLTHLLPGDRPRIWLETLDVAGVKRGLYHLALRVPNPMPQGKPLRFANQTQDQHAPGWLTLMDVATE